MSVKLQSAAHPIGLLLVSVWLGAAIFFSAVIAPTVFGVLRSFHLQNANEIAAAIVTRSLSVINLSGFVISIAVFVTLFWERGRLTRNEGEGRTTLLQPSQSGKLVIERAGHPVQARRSRSQRAMFFAGVISLAIMSIMTALSQWVISARMVSLRAAMQIPIDQIARDDPLRIAFDSLHHYSVVALGVAIISALVALIACSRPKSLQD